MIQNLEALSDDEIDALLLLLFNGATQMHRNISDFSHEELLRIRSRNHPDKWPNVNPAAYQAAVEELDRRRRAATP